MTAHRPFPTTALNAAGLNRQHVFDLAALPAGVRATLGETAGFRQLILIGHGGRRLWECVQANASDSEHPIDEHSVRTIERWLASELPGRAYRIVYPGNAPVGLQALGKLAGWHGPSPFMIGVDAEWGSWYAYRAVVLADSGFSPSLPTERESPCRVCERTPCIAACPVDALASGRLDLTACSRFRLQADSPCAHGCLARIACPVGREHRYDDAQIRHSYSRSLVMLKAWAKSATP